MLASGRFAPICIAWQVAKIFRGANPTQPRSSVETVVGHLSPLFFFTFTRVEFVHGPHVGLRLVPGAGYHGEDGLIHRHRLLPLRRRDIVFRIVSIFKAVRDIE
jgi:hypothetical protein